VNRYPRSRIFFKSIFRAHSCVFARS